MLVRKFEDYRGHCHGHGLSEPKLAGHLENNAGHLDDDARHLGDDAGNLDGGLNDDTAEHLYGTANARTNTDTRLAADPKIKKQSASTSPIVLICASFEP